MERVDDIGGLKAVPAAPAIATAAAAPRADRDLSPEIEQSMSREPLDRVRCVRLFGDYYRCNWWAPADRKAAANRAFDWAMVTTHHVRQSRFVTATMATGHLVVAEVVRPPADD